MITTLKEALHEVIENSAIPPKALAEELGISYSYLMNSGNSELPEFRFQARFLIPLTRLTGDFTAIDHIEHSLGRVAFKLPAAVAGIEETQAKLLETINRFGLLVSNASEALKDGKVDSWEAKTMERDAFELIRETLRFLDSVQRCCER